MHIQKQSVELTLDADLLRRAKGLTRDLDRTVETLLASFVETGEANATSEKVLVARWVEWSNALIDQHGSPADEHDPLD